MRHDQPRTFDGDTILHISELVEWLSQGYWVRIGGRPYHPSWIINQSLATALYRLGAGIIQRAVDVDGLPYVSDILEVSKIHTLVTPTPEQFEKATREEL